MFANLPAPIAVATAGETLNTSDNQLVSETESALPGFGGVLFNLLNKGPGGTASNGVLAIEGQTVNPETPESAEDGNLLPSFLPLAVLIPGQPLAPTHGGSEVEVATELTGAGPITNGLSALSAALRARYSLGQAGAAAQVKLEAGAQSGNADEALIPQLDLRPVTPLTQFLNQGDADGSQLSISTLAASAQPESTPMTLTAPVSTATSPLSGLANSAFTNPNNPASSTVMPPVEVPLQHNAWGQNVADRVQWMVGQNLRRADIQLTPPDLGPLEVRVVLNQDQASVSFASGHAHVRDALEAAMPRLREMFEQQGLNLANADVSQHSFAEQRQTAKDQGGARLGEGGDGISDSEDAATETASTIRRGTGMVDYYA